LRTVYQQLTVVEFVNRGAALGIQVSNEDLAYHLWDKVSFIMDSGTQYQYMS